MSDRDSGSGNKNNSDNHGGPQKQRQRGTIVAASVAVMAMAVLALSLGPLFWNGAGSAGNNDAVDGVLAAAPSSPGGWEEQGQGGGATIKEVTLVAQEADLEIAPGKVVKAWTFNGTMPAPTLRFAEGDNISVKFINKTPLPHTIHFHGNHDDANDGVSPQVMPGETYVYNITAAPAGALMYHCHAHPTSLHIRMGMYGALIVDPKDRPLQPAREFVMVMSEYDSKDAMAFQAEYYPINGYADQYVNTPLKANQGELVRIYAINIGTTIPYQFHLHSTTFNAYPSGLVEGNTPVHAQTWAIGPGDAAIIEARWEHPGTYLFHSHGFMEERGNMGQIVIAPAGAGEGAAAEPRVGTASVSMFDWQYGVQKQLQKPSVKVYDDKTLETMAQALRAAEQEGAATGGMDGGGHQGGSGAGTH
jgi:FtsP/CotA-like multicopper oxidase with cupredoxin domain